MRAMRGLLMAIVLFVSLGVSGGCGEEGRRVLPDATLVDAALDAPVDPVDQPVTLTITKRGTPVPDVRVYFLNADSSLVKAVDTDIYGQASAIMAAGGSVTAIDPIPPDPEPDPDPGVREVIVGNNDLVTFAGVKPGDNLVLTLHEPQRISVTVQLPSDPLASHYEVGTTCGSGSLSEGTGELAGPSGEITLQDCPAVTDIVVVAFDAETGRQRSALYRAGVAVADGGTIDLTAETFKELSGATFGFTNVPDTLGTVSFAHALVSPRGTLGVALSDSLEVDGGSAVGTRGEPAIAGAGRIVLLTSFIGSLHTVVDKTAPSAAYALDMAGVLLPSIDFAQYDVTSQKVTWGEAETGAQPDATIAQLDVSTASERQWRWVIVAPHRRGELTFPTLPDDIAGWAPGPADQVSVSRNYSFKVSGGYDAIRSRAHAFDAAFLASGQLEMGSFLGGSTGRVVIVQPIGIGVRRPR
jgi:hypothetical protein